MSNRAWVTLATNDSYGLGALVLANSLRRASSAYPAVVLITPSVSDAMRERLGAVFAEVVTVDVLDSRDATHLALLQRPELGITFTKIHCWSLTQYDKCVFLDADTLIVQNCDELFEREEFSAAPDVGWPDCFNSGVFVYVPSADTYSRLITFAQERGSFDGGDQGLLNAFFSDWAHGDIKKHLPFLYNVTSAAFYSYLPALKHYGQNLKIIHFIGAAKPWLQQFNWESRTVDAPEHLRELLQLWWDLFVGQVHTSLDATMGTTVEVAVEEAPPKLPPQDVLRHYAPTLDPESEFQWHHPEAQIPNMENQPQSLDTSHYHDPWEYYRGAIPPMINALAHSNVGGNKESEELMKYVWQYWPPYQEAQHKQNPWQELRKTEQHQQNQFRHEKPHQSQHRHSLHTHHHREEHTHHAHYSDNHARHQEHHSHPDHSPQQYEHHNNQHEHHDYSHYEHGVNKNKSHPQHSHDYQHHHNSHDRNQSLDDSNLQNEEPHKNLENHSERHQEQEDYNKHGHTHNLTHSVTDEPSQKIINQWSNHIKNEYSHLGSLTNHRNRVNIYRVHLDVKRQREKRNRKSERKIPDEMMNGDATDSESEDELIIPRHPYDGFYLRHRSTIDPRGRKICTHEVPPTPSPSPSPPPVSPSPLGSLSPAYSEEFLSASECEGQTGVAGNLARVVPSGSGYQREAIDELTRRQGWEAGNIDYMGADSFDNIWAKISQTLNQTRITPPKQPTPPRKEPSPPKEPEVAAPVAAPATEVPVPEVAVPEVPPPSAPGATKVPATVVAPVTEAPAVKKSTVSVQVAPPVVDVPKPEAVHTLAEPAVIDVPKTVEEALAAVDVPTKEANKTEPSVPRTPPVTPKSTPEASTPVTEVPPIVKAAAAASEVAKPAPVPATPEKSQEASKATDSPPLANTPSKEEAPAVPAAKSEERRKRAGKLQLSPPAAADAIPTPDSELEDAASLAQSIIASELSTTLTSPTPPADVTSPPPLVEQTRLTVEEPQLPTPPVSLAQIGVKPKGKPSTAAQIESSISEKPEGAPASPTTPSEPGTPTEVPKKKVVKKAAKGGSAGDAPTPVPPPRKKEKKPKEK